MVNTTDLTDVSLDEMKKEAQEISTENVETKTEECNSERNTDCETDGQPEVDAQEELQITEELQIEPAPSLPDNAHELSEIKDLRNYSGLGRRKLLQTHV